MGETTQNSIIRKIYLEIVNFYITRTVYKVLIFSFFKSLHMNLKK